MTSCEIRDLIIDFLSTMRSQSLVGFTLMLRTQYEIPHLCSLNFRNTVKQNKVSNRACTSDKLNVYFIFHCIIPETIILFKHFEHLSKTHLETLSPLLYQNDTWTEEKYICCGGSILKWHVDKGGIIAHYSAVLNKKRRVTILY